MTIERLPKNVLSEDEIQTAISCIMVNVCTSQQGDFLKTFSMAWQRADPSNKRILTIPAITLIKKYKLTHHKFCECTVLEFPHV